MDSQDQSAASMKAMGNDSILSIGTQVLYNSTFKQHNGVMNVPFPAGFFSSPPVVVTTPYWPNGTGSLETETVTNISTNGFQVISNNSSDNIAGQAYYVNWIAIGK